VAGLRNILIVAQDGRLQYEALLLAASLRHFPSNADLRLFVAEPQPGPLWSDDPRLTRPAIRRELRALGAQIVPLHNRHWGARYPHGNKIESLSLLPKGEGFLFLDTDTLITGDLSGLDTSRPTASVRVEPTWPRLSLYGPDFAAIWGALYERFRLDMTQTLDQRFGHTDWKRYLYFNAGWIIGPCPHAMGETLTHIAVEIERAPPPEMATQQLYPWLDQIALPLAISALGGGRPVADCGLDGALSLHYRALPMLYATAPDNTVTLLEHLTRAEHLWDIFNQYAAFRRMVFKGEGAILRAKIDRSALPWTYGARERAIRALGHWVR
jgi:hypothetical protein